MFPKLTVTFRRATADVGLWGEKQAAALLKAEGYRIAGKRVKAGKRDEIDIVAVDGKVLVFVEVKTRGTENRGRPLAAVDRKKRHCTSRAAVRYLKKIGNPAIPFRFDVVEVIGKMDGQKPVVRLIKNAFHLDKRYRIP